MKYLIGIDNGGTFSKAALFDEEGRQQACASRPVEPITPKPGYMERDMEQLWQANAQSIRQVLELSGIDSSDIACISFSGHGKGLYLWGQDDRPVRNGILSTDTRAWEYVEKWKQEQVHHAIYPKTFQDILVCQPVSLLAWLKDHEPDSLSQTKYIFSVKDYIRYRLTGQAYGEYSDFSGSNLINLNTMDYDEDLMALFGIREVYSKLPPLKRSFDLCGKVTEAAAAVTGLLPGTPVAAGMFDVNACGIACGLYDEGQMCMIAGTWSINEFLSKKPILKHKVSLNSMFCIPGYYLVEESSPTSAGNLEWFISNLMSFEKEAAQKTGSSVYDTANEWVRSIAPEESSLLFLPFLNGSNVNPLAKGTFIGLTAYHNKKHMLRAVYEGIVFSHAVHVERLLQNCTRPDAIRLAGGAANSMEWIQIFADVLQIPIETVEHKELGAHGAALAAGIGIGIYKDYRDAIQKTVRITDKVMPRAVYKEIYQKKYQKYRAVVDSLDGVWKTLET